MKLGKFDCSVIGVPLENTLCTAGSLAVRRDAKVCHLVATMHQAQQLRTSLYMLDLNARPVKELLVLFIEMLELLVELPKALIEETPQVEIVLHCAIFQFVFLNSLFPFVLIN